MDNRRVLVVDDDPHICDALAAALEMAGFCVATASNGIEALHAIQHERPSLVLLDIHMPLLDGPGLARMLVELGIQLPIVVMTTDPWPEIYAREMGASAFIPKPFAITQLLSQVHMSLERAS